jgi:hypothetical protein
MTCISKYIYSNCTTLAVGCTLYSDNSLQTKLGAGFHKIPVGTGQKTFTTNSNGVITAESVCSWASNIQPYAPLFTSNKNDCVGGTSCTAVGSTVTLNDGTPSNDYSQNVGYVSFISQEDANTQAQLLSEAAFNANKQAQVNLRGNCIYTYTAGTGTYSANFTKNNCASNCYANGTVNYSITKTGYSASSTVSCTQASIDANTAAYNAAIAEVNAGGQAYANANGSCCCWVADPACYLCYRYEAREINTCTGLYRNDYPTDSESCLCGQGCKGTNYDYYECVGTFGQDKLKKERFNCPPYNFTGQEILETCGCTSNTPDVRALEPLERTCIDCEYWFILRDFAVCSPTAGHYFAKGVDYGLNKPSTAACPSPNYSNYIGIRCINYANSGPANYNVFENTSSCGFRYQLNTIDGTGNVFLGNDAGTSSYCP